LTAEGVRHVVHLIGDCVPTGIAHAARGDAADCAVDRVGETGACLVAQCEGRSDRAGAAGNSIDVPQIAAEGVGDRGTVKVDGSAVALAAIQCPVAIE
jgi:hypothetical protein